MSVDTCNVLWSAACNQLEKKRHQTKAPERKQQEDSMTVLSSKQQGAPVTTLTKASAVRRLSYLYFQPLNFILEAAEIIMHLARRAVVGVSKSPDK